MTIREYITQKLAPFEVNDATFEDLASTLDVMADYTADDAEAVGKALVSIIEEKVMSPQRKSISESGFAISWDYSRLGKYYLWLCKRWGITPSDDTLSLMELSTITDKTDLW